MATANDVEVRRAEVADWQLVRELRLAALADTPDAFGAALSDEQARPADWWRDRLARDDQVTLLAHHHGRPAGLTVVSASFDDPAAAGIYAVWVVPTARGRGVGDALVTAALRVASEFGFERVLLDVGDHNDAAQQLYARAGFTPTGRTGTLPGSPHITEHELGRDLPSA